MSEPAPFSGTPCRACRRSLVWAISKQIDTTTGQPKNTKIPLDPSAAVYAVRSSNSTVICLPARDFLAIRRERIAKANQRVAAIHDLARTMYVRALNKSLPSQHEVAQAIELLESPAPVIDLDEDVSIYVSHLKTCPDAARFVRGKDRR